MKSSCHMGMLSDNKDPSRDSFLASKKEDSTLPATTLARLRLSLLTSQALPAAEEPGVPHLEPAASRHGAHLQ